MRFSGGDDANTQMALYLQFRWVRDGENPDKQGQYGYFAFCPANGAFGRNPVVMAGTLA